MGEVKERLAATREEGIQWVLYDCQKIIKDLVRVAFKSSIEVSEEDVSQIVAKNLMTVKEFQLNVNELSLSCRELACIFESLEGFTREYFRSMN